MFRCLSALHPEQNVLNFSLGTLRAKSCSTKFLSSLGQSCLGPAGTGPEEAMGAVDKHTQTAADEIYISLNNPP